MAELRLAPLRLQVAFLVLRRSKGARVSREMGLPETREGSIQYHQKKQRDLRANDRREPRCFLGRVRAKHEPFAPDWSWASLG